MPRRLSPPSWDESIMGQRGEMAEALEHSDGVIATARRQGHAKQLEKPSLPQAEMLGER